MESGSSASRLLRVVAGVVLGWATFSAVLAGGLAALRTLWPEYGLAEPEKAYTLAMLFARLLLFSATIAATSAVASRVAGHSLFPWVVGGVILALSVPGHLYPGHIWDDYPAWYHYAYLLLIVPVAVVAGRAAQGRLALGLR